MKIIYAIVGSDDGNRVTDVLTEHKFSVTRLSTTGGFCRLRIWDQFLPDI